MFLDEKLVKSELKRNAKPDDNEEIERLKEEILRQEKEQRPVSEFIGELRAGKLIVDEVEFTCERTAFFEERSYLYLCREDMERMLHNEPGFTVIYKTLEMGINLAYMKEPMVIKNEKEYQKQMKEHLRRNQVPYYPVNTGRLTSGGTRISYASGITTSSIGGIYVVHFYYKRKGHVMLGSFSCSLLRRYSFEHLFMAMLHLICEEEG